MEFLAIFAELGLPQQFLLSLSARRELAPIVNAVVSTNDMDLATAILSTLSCCQVDELAPLFNPLAAFFRRVLVGIEAEALSVTADCEGAPRDCLGYLSYTISNGWRLEIYNRVYQWHYLAGFESPNGYKVDLTDYTLPNPLAELMDYEPPPSVLTKIYRFDWRTPQ